MRRKRYRPPLASTLTLSITAGGSFAVSRTISSMRSPRSGETSICRCAAAARTSADEREPQELEGFRFAKAAPSALDRCKAAKLDQAGLIRVKRQRVFPQSLAHRIPESSGVGLILEANDDIVGVSYDDHVTRRLTPSPALGPKVEEDGRDEP